MFPDGISFLIYSDHIDCSITTQCDLDKICLHGKVTISGKHCEIDKSQEFSAKHLDQFLVESKFENSLLIEVFEQSLSCDILNQRLYNNGH